MLSLRAIVAVFPGHLHGQRRPTNLECCNMLHSWAPISDNQLVRSGLSHAAIISHFFIQVVHS